MRFNDNARLDTSQVEDRRRSGGGTRRVSGRQAAIGGGGLGIVGILVLVAFMVFGGGGSGGGTLDQVLGQLAGGGGQAEPVQVDDATLREECSTGADANTDETCAAVAMINSVQSYWQGELARSGTTYRPSTTVFYNGATPTGGCGTGQSGMGPFYCPADQKVYIDLSFWDELKTTFGANDALFTQAYVIAHEYGHHVQNLLGTSDRVGRETGADSGAVRLELQADCYAGAWANHATTVAGADGQVLITEVSQADIANALETAASIGDDYIQTQVSGGQVNEDAFSHGSSAQRQKWFNQGWTTGDPATCNTFDTDNLG